MISFLQSGIKHFCVIIVSLSVYGFPFVVADVDVTTGRGRNDDRKWNFDRGRNFHEGRKGHRRRNKARRVRTFIEGP